MQRMARRVGFGRFVYREVKQWAQMPEGWWAEDGPAVAVDSHDRVYLLIRNRSGLLCFDPQRALPEILGGDSVRATPWVVHRAGRFDFRRG